jgi:AmmeMemoRadiSam system protein A
MDSSEDKHFVSSNSEQSSLGIDELEGEKLLRLARSAIEQYLLHGKIPDNRNSKPSNPWGTGIFVTLWSEQSSPAGESLSEELVLRGCIGHLQSNLPLHDLVQEVAVGAATRDPRFLPLTTAELDTTRIEVAILSPLRPISDLQQVNIGQDGLMIDGLGKRGLLLPKVAVRMGWDQSAFLEGVCKKAGLPLHCWPGTSKLYAFTTIVFAD